MTEGDYYSEETRLMFDTHDGPQYTMAFCRDAETATEIAAVLNKVDADQFKADEEVLDDSNS